VITSKRRPSFVLISIASLISSKRFLVVTFTLNGMHQNCWMWDFSLIISRFLLCSSTDIS
jgi:hypothetical protein